MVVVPNVHQVRTGPRMIFGVGGGKHFLNGGTFNFVCPGGGKWGGVLNTRLLIQHSDLS